MLEKISVDAPEHPAALRLGIGEQTPIELSEETSSRNQESASSSSSLAEDSASSAFVRVGPVVQLRQQVAARDSQQAGAGGSARGAFPDDPHQMMVGTSSSVESGKRYRNSPFGLTNHHLAMPTAGANPAARKLAAGQHGPDDESSVGSLSPPWPGYDHEPAVGGGDSSGGDHRQHAGNMSVHLSQPKKRGPIGLVGLANSHYGDAASAPLNLALSPAGDAGLDAKKCNAKDLEGCYFSASRSNLDQHGDQHGDLVGNLRAHKLQKLDELGQPAHESGGLLVAFSSMIYATFLVILGCILHVSELRQKSKNSSDHIYTIIVALVGIIWLLFLQTDLHRYKKCASKYILIETILCDRNKQQQSHTAGAQLDHPSSARSTSASSAASLVNDRMSMNTEVIFKKTAYKMYQHQRAALGKAQAKKRPAHRNQHRAESKLSNSSEQSGAEQCDHLYHGGKQSSSRASSTVGLQSKGSIPSEDCLAGVDCNKLEPAYKFLHGKMGANFYLKCGMAAFCFGHVIHEGLRFGQQVYFFGDGNVHCRDLAALIAHLVTPLYSFYQLFMMFKYSNLVINRHKILARFGLMHIIGTSVTFWFRTIMEEAFEDFVHKMDYFNTNKPQISLTLAKPADNNSSSSLMALLDSISDAIKTEASERSDWSLSGQQSDRTNHTKIQTLLNLMSSPISATISPELVRHLPDSYACAQNTLLTTKSMNALPYLYPFTIEYNLLLAATFLSLYFNIGKIGLSQHGDIACKPFLTGNHHSGSYSNISGKQRSSSSISSSHRGLHFESGNHSSRANKTRHSGGSEKESAGEYKSNFVVNADCHSANKGLFCGFFVLLVTLVTIVIFFVTINKPTHIQLGIKINLIQEASLTALLLIVTLAGFKQIVKLNRNPYLKEKVTTDDVLMLIPLPFFFIHSLLSFRAETASMSSGGYSIFSTTLLHGGNQQLQHNSMTTSIGNLQSILLSTNNSTQLDSIRSSKLNNLLAGRPNGTNGRFVEEFISNTNNNNSNSGNNRNGRNISSIDAGSSSSNSSQIDHFKSITVALNIIVMIEVLVQTNFIIDGMRRCSESRYLRFKKPGRELITFAILLNITYWIVATFETKSVEQYKTEIEYYGPLPYMFISHTTLPVMLFYRYHSSVCLAEIWNRAYKPPKKR